MTGSGQRSPYEAMAWWTRRGMVSLVATGAAACSDGGAPREGNWPAPVHQPGSAVETIALGDAESLDLAPWFGPGSTLVGVAVGENGERYVLDQNTGLHRLAASGSSERVLDATDLERRFGVTAALTLTDVVAYGPDRFLITAENDGFLLDLSAGTFASYFCYLPPVEDVASDEPVMSVSQALAAQGIAVTQRTESVAYNENTREIFAQPQTLRLDGASAGIAGSELFVFNGAGGQPLAVMALADLEFSAGGMVANADRLLLGSGNALYELWADNSARVVSTLEPGVSVTGLALDRDGSLLILDGPNRRLLDVALFLRPNL